LQACTLTHALFRPLFFRSMPIMDGLTAVRTILSNLGATAPPIVVLTASASERSGSGATPPARLAF
jgi:CheY-like chemotaxis protein